MQSFLRFIASLVMLAFLAACGEKSTPPPASSIIEEISGVWRANTDGSMLSVIHTEKRLRLFFGDRLMPVSLGDIDNVNKTANLNVTLADGKPGVWTVRQLWNREKTSFYLQLTLHDGTQDQLSFVRKISTDDLNRIASAESSMHRGAIGESMTSASTSSSVPVALPPRMPPITVSASDASAATPAPAQIQTAPVPSASAMWTPSFDCAKVSTGPERLICSSRELSEADVKLSVAYRTALNTSADKEVLKASQNAWRKNERDACSDVSCMLAAYQGRLSDLEVQR